MVIAAAVEAAAELVADAYEGYEAATSDVFDRPIMSSWIIRASYDRATQTLIMQMPRGQGVYELTGVPPDVAAGLWTAPSAGAYFNANLRGQY